MDQRLHSLKSELNRIRGRNPEEGCALIRTVWPLLIQEVVTQAGETASTLMRERPDLPSRKVSVPDTRGPDGRFESRMDLCLVTSGFGQTKGWLLRWEASVTMPVNPVACRLLPDCFQAVSVEECGGCLLQWDYLLIPPWSSIPSILIPLV